MKRKNYEVLNSPSGAYVHAVEYESVLYLSGLTAYQTQSQNASLPVQARAIFAQLREILQVENKDFRDLIKVTIFVTEMTELQELREVLMSFYGEHLPASSLVQVAGLFLPELKIEVEATVAIS